MSGVARSSSALLGYGALLLHAIHEAWADGSGHRLETRAVRVQVIARATYGRIPVKGWQELLRVTRVAHGRVEVDHPVEFAARPDELVHLHAPRVGLRSTVQVECGASTWRNGRANDREPVIVHAADDLTHSGDHL